MCAFPSPATTTSPPARRLAETPDVSVIIVNYNVREFLEQALDSVLRAATRLSAEVFVVDNNSVDGSAEMVRRRFPDVRLIANEENLGFARANNQAIREARGRHLLILNPDTLLQEDTLRTLVAFLDEHPDAGAVGCRILNPDGTFAPESRRAFPTPSVALYRMLGLSRLFPKSPVFGRYNLSYLPANQVCEVDALSGSCMLVRRDALVARFGSQPPASRRNGAPSQKDFEDADGAGLFDESFFMYGEDLDWCFRIRQAGWKIYYTPDSQIIHYKGESTRKGELRYVRLFYGAMLQFTDKHFADRHSRAVASLIRAGIVARGALSAAGKMLSSLAVPILDFAVALAITLAVGLLWAARAEVLVPGFYFGVLAPGSAAAATIGIGAMGGYRRRSQRGAHRLRPVWLGLPIAFLVVASLLFFLPDLAFSRAVTGLSFVGMGLLLLGWRVAVNRRFHGSRSGLLVGERSEAERLHMLLGRRLDPPLRLLGFVSDSDRPDGGVARLGGTRHLRDLVRLRGVDDVIFAANSLTNTQILGMMRTLRDLPVQFKILTEGQDRIIGKASIDDLSTPLREAEAFVAPVRSFVGTRVLEVSVAALGILVHPFIRAALRLRPDSAGLRRVGAVTARLPSVVAGRRALVGFDSTGIHPPNAWGLRPGLVSILDTLPQRPTEIVETHRAYWFYARNQSVGLDLEILVRALLRHGK